MQKFGIFFLFILFFCCKVYAQPAPVVPPYLYGIKNPELDYPKFCGRCTGVMESKPAEVGVGIQYNEEDNFLYFVMTDVKYFNKLFMNPNDGISVDILHKGQFACGVVKKTTANAWLYNGYLIPPIFTPEIKKNTVITPEGYVIVKLRAVPAYFKTKEIEFNMVLLQDRYKCWYQNFYNINDQKWGMLEMGMYMDTLTEENINERSRFINKLLKFEIPFAKDKAEYLAKDIKPLYDSLKISNYIITSVSIRAYSSVEGSEERNLLLQEKRSQSIVKALQSLQAINFDSVKKDVVALENWVDFYGSIIDGRFSFLNDLSKEEIKAKFIADKKLAVEMEPLLKKQRKAIVILELQPKSALKESDPEKIKKIFEQVIASKNVKDALNIQREIFMRIRSNKLPEDFIDKLEVPEGIDYGLLKNNNLAFRYQEEVTDFFNTLKQFKLLADVMPDNHRIKYNIIVLQLKGWLSSEIIIDPDQLKVDIEALKKYSIDKRLIKRLMINYNILLCEKLMNEKKYDEKNNALKYIYDNYAFLNLSEEDLVSLAQYFVGYGKSDWATTLLYPYVKKVDAGENIVFYYINLTIAYEEKTQSKEYRAILLNAFNKNKTRFCSLFNTCQVNNGMTFQLLGNPELKKVYCENCR